MKLIRRFPHGPHVVRFMMMMNLFRHKDFKESVRKGGFAPRVVERNIKIIEDRFGLGDEDWMTLREVGDRYGLTPERIRQIQSKMYRVAYRRISTQFTSRPRVVGCRVKVEEVKDGN